MDARSEPAVRADRLTKAYKTAIAVDGISFALQPGSVTGLLGGNGAGKTTTIAMLMGLVTPTSGTVRVFGAEMPRERYRVLQRMNFESPYVEMPMRLTIRQNLTVFGMLYGVRDLKDLDIDQFLKLMISELTNQDPLNPMDNTQLVQQIGELRSIAASDQLTGTLQSLQTQQSLTTASSLIGKQVTALTSDNENVSGKVTSVSVEVDPENSAKRTYKVKIGSQTIDLQNVRNVEN